MSLLATAANFSSYSAGAISGDAGCCEEPHILSFESFRTAFRQVATADNRARAEYHNRCCEICNKVTVRTIELNNGTIGRNGLMVPGTGTLVGFSCQSCGHEWPA